MSLIRKPRSAALRHPMPLGLRLVLLGSASTCRQPTYSLRPRNVDYRGHYNLNRLIALIAIALTSLGTWQERSCRSWRDNHRRNIPWELPTTRTSLPELPGSLSNHTRNEYLPARMTSASASKMEETRIHASLLPVGRHASLSLRHNTAPNPMAKTRWVPNCQLRMVYTLYIH